MGKLSVIVGGQFGSEAKGSVCAWLVRQNRKRDQLSTVVRVAGPNAGHTAYDDEGRPWALRQVPVGLVADPKAVGVIADGSEIDLPVLLREVRELTDAGHNIAERLVVSSRATLLTDHHHRQELNAQLTERVGSTGKGIGAARSARILRRAATAELVMRESDNPSKALREFLHDEYEQARGLDWPMLADTLDQLNWSEGSTVGFLEERLASSHVMIEGTQGYGLGLHRPEYPQVTSSDARAIDFLAMAGLNPWSALVTGFEVWVVVRAFPIRVAGNSGPLRDETTWEALGLPEELTTVTKKVRRVGGWDPDLFRAAVRANGMNAVKVAYTMADQQCPDLAGLHGEAEKDVRLHDLTPAAREAVDQINRRTAGLVRYIGTGPKTQLWMGDKK